MKTDFSHIPFIALIALGMISLPRGLWHWRESRATEGFDKSHHLEDAFILLLGAVVAIPIGLYWLFH
jgi:hypothetical protein